MKQGILAAVLLLPLAACGTLFFPERQHAANTGRIDPNIVIFDGIGLFFFIVPGLVAYAVDFATGAIYLPQGVERGEGPFFRDREPRATSTRVPDSLESEK